MTHTHDHPRLRHATAAATVSLLRLSAVERLLGVAGVILALWVLVWLVLE